MTEAIINAPVTGSNIISAARRYVVLSFITSPVDAVTENDEHIKISAEIKKAVNFFINSSKPLKVYIVGIHCTTLLYK